MTEKMMTELFKVFGGCKNDFMKEFAVLYSLLAQTDEKASQEISAGLSDGMKKDLKEFFQNGTRDEMKEALVGFLSSQLNEMLSPERIYNRRKALDGVKRLFSNGAHRESGDVLEVTGVYYPEYLDVLESQILSMRDIIGLLDTYVQRILEECSVEVIAAAICDEEDDVKEKFFFNMTLAARKYVTECMENYRDDPVSRNEAKDRIISLCHQLEEAGDISTATIWDKKLRRTE